MIRIPLYLAVAQWALLGGLGALVIVAFRQLGGLLSAPAKTAGLGPPVGSQAARLSYVPVGARLAGDDQVASDQVGRGAGGQARRWLTPGDGTGVLLAFVDPTCPSCEELLRVLGELLAEGALDGLRVLALISDPPSYLRISEVFAASRIEIGRPAEPAGLDAYQVSGTPLLVAIDPAGQVRAAGSVLKIGQVRAYAEACLSWPAGGLPVLAGRPAVRESGLDA